MSRANPTPLRVGMSGQIQGRRYTVRGRVVLSMVADDGERYHWNEFDMVEAGGTTATLVFEETEEGPTWKWFTLLEPRRPLTAGEAARKRVGETIEFEGRQIPITLVDQSRVEHIEGEAPEGVEVGDVADYFNADASGGRMFVASWTDDEIEFYIGRDLKRRSVDEAFGIATPGQSAASSPSFGNFSTGVLWSVAAIVGFIVIGVVGEVRSSHRVVPAPDVQAAPAQRLPAEFRGLIDNQEYRVLAHKQTTVLLRSSRFQQHEYWMESAGGERALLLHGWGGAGQRLFFQQVAVPGEFTPQVAASLKRTTTISLGGDKYVITDLLLTRSGQAAASPAGSPWPAAEQYGFMARLGNRWLLCRWTETTIQWYLGRTLSINEIQPAGGGT